MASLVTTTVAGTLAVKLDAGLTVERTSVDSRFRMFNTGGEWILASTFGSTGAYDPIKFQTSDVTRLTIAANGAATFAGALTATAGTFSGKLTAFLNTTSACLHTRGSNIFFDASSSGTNVNIVARAYDETYWGQMEFTANQGILYTRTTGSLILGANNAGAIYIVNGGKVGIGTGVPGEKLTVWNSNISLGKRQNSVTSYIGKGTGANGQTFGSNSNWIAFASDGTDDWITFGTHESGVGGGERVRIAPSGNVGIGTTSPDSKLMIQGGAWNTSLKIKGAGATSGITFVDSDNNIDGSIYASSSSIGFLDSGSDWMIKCANDSMIQFSTNGNTEHMRITSAGKVFIGDTTASNAQLRVKQSTSGEWAANIINHQSVAYGLSIDTSSSSNTSAYNFAAYTPAGTGFFVTNIGNVGIGDADPDQKLSLITTASNHAILAIDSAGATNHAAVLLRSGGVDKWQVGNEGASDRFRIYNYATASEAVTVLSDGNVGIGTTSPDSKLEIVGGGYNSSLKIKGSGSHTGIQFEDSDGNTDGYVYSAGLSVGLLDAGTNWTIECQNNNFIRFCTNDDTEHMRIKSDGNIGIGTTVPVTQNGDMGTLVSIYSGTSSKNTAISLTYTGGTDSQWALLEGRNTSAAGGEKRVSQIGLGNPAGGEQDRGAITFGVFRDGSYTEAGRFISDGNLGLGEAAPGAKLTVAGNAIITSTNPLYMGGNATSIGSWVSRQYATGQNHYLGCNGFQVNNIGYVSPATTFLHIYSTGQAIFRSIVNNHNYHYIDTTSGGYNPILGFLEAGTRRAYINYVSADNYLSITTEESGSDITIMAASDKVGVGTTSPATTLDVDGIITSRDLIKIGAAGVYGQITFLSDRLILNGASGKALSLGTNGAWDKLFMDTAGKVGIGTTTPAYLFDVNGAARIVDGISSPAFWFRPNAFSVHCWQPKGGWFHNQTDVHTGAIKITLPPMHDAMVTFWVDVYEYRDNESFSAYISGYPYQGSTWSYTSAVIIGGVARNFTVRFGDNNTAGSSAEYYVYIGETDSTWNHPQVVVRDVFCGYHVYANEWDGDDAGFGVSFATSFENVAKTQSNTLPYGDYNKLINVPASSGVTGTGTDNYVPRWNGTTALQNSSIYADDNGNVGVGNAVPGNFKLNVSGAVYASGSVVIANGTPYFGALNSAGAAQQLLTLNSSNQLLLGSSGIANAGYPARVLAKYITFEPAGNLGAPVETMRVTNKSFNSVGSVGIGITAPVRLLHVYSGTENDVVANFSSLSNSSSAPAAGLTTHIDVGSGHVTNGVARITGHHNLYQDSRSYLSFSTNSGSGVGEKMRIMHDGKVGIGTTAPAGKLHVQQVASDQSGAAAIKAVGTAYGTNKVIHSYMGTTSATKSLFYAENSNGVVMNIAGNGNVGIGTATPAATLDVRRISAAAAEWTAAFCSDNQTLATAKNHDSVLIQASDVPCLKIYEAASTPQVATLAVGDGNATLASSNTLRFFVNGSNTGDGYNGLGGTEAITINTSGSVGIGTPPLSGCRLRLAGGTYPLRVVAGSGEYYFGSGVVYANSGGGMYFVNQSNYLSLGAHNYEMIRINGASGGAGKVGVNEATPNAALHVTGRPSYTTASLAEVSGLGFVRFQPSSTVEDSIWIHNAGGHVGFQGTDDPTTDTTVPLTLNAYGGSVGIGTASPEVQLHVKAGDGVTGVIKIEGGKGTVTSVGEINSELQFGSNDASVGGDNIGGKISSVTEYSNGAYVGLAFHTFLQSNPNLAERVRITYDGKVGIGTTSPGGFLSVEGAGNSRGIFVKSAGATTYSAIQAEADALTTGSIARLSSNSATTNTRYLVNVINDNAAATGAVGLRIQQDSTAPALVALGNVGIGTGSPATPLHVWSTSYPQFRVSYNSALYFTLDHAATLNVYGNDWYVRLNGSEKFRIKQDGKIGIGTNNPLNILTLHQAAGANIRFSNPTTGRYFIVGEGVGAPDKFSFRGNSYRSTDTLTVNFTTDRVGIGTMSPTAPLEVRGADSGITISSASSSRPHLRLVNGTTNMLQLSANGTYAAIGDGTDANRYMSFKGGSVGIGTVSPIAPLNTSTGAVANTTNKIVASFGGGHSGNQYGSFILRLTRNPNESSVSETDSGSYGDMEVNSGGSGPFRFSSTYDDVNFVTGTHGGTSGPYGNMNFVTGTGSNTKKISMRIGGGTNGGKVGIGTIANFNSVLNIYGATSGGPTSIITCMSADATVGGGAGIFFKTSNNHSLNRYGAQIAAIRRTNDNGSPDLLFKLEQTNATGLVERMRILGDGKVGIGTTNPGQLLEVGNDGNSDYALIGPTIIGGGMGHGDYAGFSHRSLGGTGNYCLLQYSNGNTYLNAASGRTVSIRVNNTNILNITGSLATFHVGSSFTSWLKTTNYLYFDGAIGQVLMNTVDGSDTKVLYLGGGGDSGSGRGGYLACYGEDHASSPSDVNVVAGNSGSFNVYTGGAGPRLTIASAGAATFSGSAKFDGGIKDKNNSTGSASQVLHADGAGKVYWTAAGGGSGTVTGTGTDNYVPRWNGTTALQNSAIYAKDDGKVGIGTTNPGIWKLRVEGPAFFNGSVAIPNASNYFGAYDSSGALKNLLYLNSSDQLIINADGAMAQSTRIEGKYISFATPDTVLGVETEVMRVFQGAGFGAAGCVGIGVTTPSSKLDVNGTITGTSKNFNIPHPDPSKINARLVHASVEAPSNDTLYKFEVVISLDNETVTHPLPSYFKYLNKNPQMWIQARNMFSHAYGSCAEDLSSFSITGEKAGSYDVLIIATRKDEGVKGFEVEVF